MSRAVRRLKNVSALCYFEGLKTNDGFGMNLSFNASSYRAAGGRDFIEVAPRAATLHFRPKNAAGWSWSDALSALVVTTTEQVTVKSGDQRSSGTTSSHTFRAEGGAEANLHLPLLIGAKGRAKRGREVTASKADATIQSAETTRTRSERWLQMMRPSQKLFELRLTSPPEDDLVRLNPELNHVSVLYAPEPGTLDPRDVEVTLSAQLTVKGEKINHSLRIRDAGGTWARLLENSNKKAVAELLISRFLQPLHAPRVIWPPKGPANG